MIRKSLLVLIVATAACGAGGEEIPVAGVHPLQGNCSVSLASNPAAGAVAGGATVSYTATGSCQSGTPEYHFSIKDPTGKWSNLQKWSASNTAAWDTTGDQSGNYQVLVKVRAQGVSDPWEGYVFSGTYTITGGVDTCSAATIRRTTQVPEYVNLRASATCPTGKTPEYKFLVRDPASNWRLVQNWSADDDARWYWSGHMVGAHVYRVYVRVSGTTVAYDTYADATETFTTGAGYCPSPTLSVSPGGPVSAGATVSLTAASTCVGSGATAEYRFVGRAPTGVTTILGDWSSSANLSWDTTGALDGTHSLYVQSRAMGSVYAYDGQSAFTSFTVNAAGGFCTAATLSASPASPSAAGTTVTLTGGATCPGGSTPEYRFVSRGPDGLWRTARGWSSSSTYAWATSGAATGTYTFYFYARVTGSTQPYEAYAGPITHEITGGAGICDQATVSATPASPASVGDTVNIVGGSTCSGGALAEYRFLAYRPDGVFMQLCGWSSQSACSWDTTGASTGTWKLQVYSRRQGSPQSAEGISSQLSYPLVAGTPVLERVNVSSAGVAANAHGNLYETYTAVSTSGRFVAFSTTASNLVAGDTNNASDVFLRDRTLGTTTRISLDENGLQAAYMSRRPVISDNGRYIAFSTYSDLMASDTNGTSEDIYMYDRVTQGLTLVSVNASGVAVGGDQASISSNGRFVVFDSATGVYRFDANTGGVVRADTDASGANPSAGTAEDGDISSDGRYISFRSRYGGLVSGDSGGSWDIFVKDLATGAISMINRTATGQQLHNTGGGPTISDDGDRVAFFTYRDAIPAKPTGWVNQLYVKVRSTGEVLPVSVNNAGDWGNAETTSGRISGDGWYVVFESIASNLNAADTSAIVDIFVRDLQEGTTRLMTPPISGAVADAWSRYPSISRGGDFVVFLSLAGNLVSGDGNSIRDVFLATNP